MQTENDIGFVIYSRPYKEHGRHIELFTLQHGRVSAYQKSSKKGFSKTEAELQVFCPLNLSWKAGVSQRVIITECSLSSKPLSLTIPYIFTGMYCNELLYYLYYGKESCVELFGSYVAELESLSKGDGDLTCLRRFQITLLEALGYGLSIDIDERELERDLRYTYSLGEGFYIQESVSGRLGFTGSELLKIKLGDLSAEKLKQLLSKIFLTLLKGRPLKSRRLYEDYLCRECCSGQVLSIGEKTI